MHSKLNLGEYVMRKLVREGYNAKKDCQAGVYTWKGLMSSSHVREGKEFDKEDRTVLSILLHLSS
jgi:hypothetical protein